MIERNTLKKVQIATGLQLVALLQEWDAALAGYTVNEQGIRAVYDYDVARVHFGDSPENFDDRLLDALKAASAGSVEPLIIHTRNS